ncbi:hypothetical protein [Arthrobacter burdickii]|uniref:Uncharacterized protein n=1 Tax=Arthrobacter burdickii TaxID=3035920 RepID=A0ABT8K313_9MICC|nr:hypothetical protein [Arthrobacter burdickii]MDN4611467.1 hypothetical protein [Arthrobacter burdickii]
MKQLGSTLAVDVLIGSTLLATPDAAQAYSYVRVCASYKCVTVPSYRYKPVGSYGGGYYRFRPYDGYCSSSFGCFRLNGRNYIAINGPIPTAAERNAMAQCAVFLGLTVASAASGGTLGWTLLGVGTTIWGCASI